MSTVTLIELMHRIIEDGNSETEATAKLDDKLGRQPKGKFGFQPKVWNMIPVRGPWDGSSHGRAMSEELWSKLTQKRVKR